MTERRESKTDATILNMKIKIREEEFHQIKKTAMHLFDYVVNHHRCRSYSTATLSYHKNVEAKWLKLCSHQEIES